jgi:hypothetical protein
MTATKLGGETVSTLNLVVEKRSSDALPIKLSGDASEKGQLLSVGVVRAALDKASGVRLLSFESAGVFERKSFQAIPSTCGDKLAPSHYCRDSPYYGHGTTLGRTKTRPVLWQLSSVQHWFAMEMA